MRRRSSDCLGYTMLAHRRSWCVARRCLPRTENLPSAGCSVGPYFLWRELGRGSFARVFLAEQIDLENRLVVVKVATHFTREPWLLARVRHPHVVEVVSHALLEDFGFHLICMPFLGGATLLSVLAENKRRWPVATGTHLLRNLDAVAAPEFPVSGAARPARNRGGVILRPSCGVDRCTSGGGA